MRQADVSRNTSETKIQITLNLDGTGKADLNSGVPFLDHMLDQIARHGMIDLKVHAQGDTHIDDHHTVEDVGITLGQAIARAVGDKAGITRYGHSYVPLDETLSRVVIDFSGRPGLEFNVPFTRARVGDFDVFALPVILRETGKPLAEVLHILAEKSGLEGICGSKDLRDIEAGIAAGSASITCPADCADSVRSNNAPHPSSATTSFARQTASCRRHST